MSKLFVRSIRNLSGSPLEVKVRNLTSNDPWGPSGSDLDEISKFTFDNEKLKVVIKVLNKRLSPKQKSPLHILKSLTIIQYCLQVGSQAFVDYYKVNIEFISLLLDYDILNKANKDAVNIRKRSRYIVRLLNDVELLRQKRENFHKLRSEMLIPGIKSSDRDKTKHMRYSLDRVSSDIEQIETMSTGNSSEGARSSSLDMRRLNYYRPKRSAVGSPRMNVDEKRKLQFITEEQVEDLPDWKLASKIELLALDRSFRNTVFLDSFENSSLSTTPSNSSSATSLNDGSLDRKGETSAYNNNPFLSSYNSP